MDWISVLSEETNSDFLFIYKKKKNVAAKRTCNILY